MPIIFIVLGLWCLVVGLLIACIQFIEYRSVGKGILGLALAFIGAAGIYSGTDTSGECEYITPIHYSVDEKNGIAVFVDEVGESFTTKEFMALKNPSNVVVEIKTHIQGNLWPLRTTTKSLVVKELE